MSDSKVFFFTEDIEFSFGYEQSVKEWLDDVVSSEQNSLNSANIIFCSDDYILKINQEHLSHDYYTDIITFPLMDFGSPIETDIFISIDTVRSNASKLHVGFDQELFRVIVHGFLHLLGYDDKTLDDQRVMRSKENYYLEYFESHFR
ncbi:MAG TPA: rRNA maturation RNase YbeY [Saprospiraceae bacterium]|nr:rRNA maturation RNase YbeY [Saprospiraceae bacterium]